MKSEIEILQEKSQILDKMILIGKTEGVNSFRFLHLAVTMKALEWVTGTANKSALDMDHLFDLVNNTKDKEIIEKLKEVLDTHIGGGASKFEETIGFKQDAKKGGLDEKLKEILQKRKDRDNNSSTPTPSHSEGNPAVGTVLERVEESREIKKQRKDKDITKSKEFKALALKLGIKI